MLGFFKARTRTAAPAAPSAKPSMKVTPRGKTSRYRTFHKDEKGNEHGNRILVQDEDDNWYSEERNSKTGEVGYREYKVAGAGTDTRYNSITGRKEPVAEYDSKKQRIASDLARYNQTLRQEGGDIDRLSGDPFHHAGTKNAKVFGNIQYLPPVDPRNKKTIAVDTEREARDAPFKAPGFAGGPRIAPKKTGYDSFDHADRKAKEAKLTSEINSYMGDYHKVKPKSATGYDSFDAGFAKPYVTPKPAGTESAGSTRKPYDDKATDDFFGKLYSVTRKPSAKPPVIPVAETVTEPVTEPETPPPASSSGKSTKKSSKKGVRPKKSSS